MKIPIKGAIIDNDDQWIYDWFEIEATSPKSVQRQLEKAKENEVIEVEINSGGGSLYAGCEIYTMLKDCKNKVITKIVGLAASAASLIAMGGNKVLISPTGQLMIHNVSCVFGGDYRDMEKGAEILKNLNATISNAYMLKTGLTTEQLLEMMNEETWLTPQQALDSKFVDEIMFTDGTKMVASVNNGMLPQEVINKMREKLKNEFPQEKPQEPNEEPQINNDLELEKAKLKLRGNL